jgi:hypothetical protein
MELPLIPAYASQVLARLRCSDRASHIMPMFDLLVEVEPYRCGFVRGRSTPDSTGQDWTAVQMRQLMAWTAAVGERDD